MPSVEAAAKPSGVSLFCTPAVDHSQSADRIQLGNSDHEYHVVADRARPLDFEVHSVTRVTGYGAKGEAVQEFCPFTDVGTAGSRPPRLVLHRSAREHFCPAGCGPRGRIELSGRRGLRRAGRRPPWTVPSGAPSALRRDTLHQPRSAASHAHRTGRNRLHDGCGRALKSGAGRPPRSP